MILNGQCLKLVDNSLKYINVNIDDIENSINEPFMAEPLKSQINDANNILFITSPDISESVYEYFLKLCSGKKVHIAGFYIPEKFKEYEVVFNKSNTDEYDFFGAAAGRAAMLVHKSVKEYDLIIVISSVVLNSFGGFLGSVSTLFTNVTANKTIMQVIKYTLQDIISTSSYSKLLSGVTIRNPIYESMREGLVTAGKAIHGFAVNIVSDYKHEDEIKHPVFSGDVFISQIEAQNVISAHHKKLVPATLYDGIKLNIKCYNNVIYFVSLIEFACKMLLKGGRLLISIDDMQSFGNKAFQECFYNNTLEEMVSSINEDNYMEVFYSILLKYYTLNYHIALPFNEKLNDKLIQAGLNPLKDDEYNNFLSNCHNMVEL